MPRKKYNTDFKMNAVLEVLKEEKSMSQIASEYGVHVNQLRQWRDVALENWPLVSEAKNRQIEVLRSEYEQKIQALYAEVGKLSTQLAWAEKKSTVAESRRKNRFGEL